MCEDSDLSEQLKQMILFLQKFFNHFKHITKLKARQHQQHKTETCGTMMKKYLLVFKQVCIFNFQKYANGMNFNVETSS